MKWLMTNTVRDKPFQKAGEKRKYSLIDYITYSHEQEHLWLEQRKVLLLQSRVGYSFRDVNWLHN